MDRDDKNPASFNAAPNIEDCGIGVVAPPAAGEDEQIKRDLQSRHINMIAIAGMIVRFLTVKVKPQLESFQVTSRLTGTPEVFLKRGRVCSSARAPSLLPLVLRAPFLPIS